MVLCGTYFFFLHVAYFPSKIPNESQHFHKFNILPEFEFSWLHEMHQHLLTNSLFFDTEIVPNFLV